MIHLVDPLVDLCQRHPGIRRLVKKFFNLVPHREMQHMKDIMSVLDDTSRRIYAEKKAALASNDVDVMAKVTEGRDLMSVMRQ